MQHAGLRLKGDHALWYHAYIIPEETDLKDAAPLVYCDSLRRMPNRARGKLMCLHSVDEDPSDANVERLVNEEVNSSEAGCKRKPHWCPRFELCQCRDS